MANIIFIFDGKPQLNSLFEDIERPLPNDEVYLDGELYLVSMNQFQGNTHFPQGGSGIKEYEHIKKPFVMVRIYKKNQKKT